MEQKPLAYHFDDVRVEPGAFRVFKQNQAITLEPKAFEVLLYLIEHRERLIEKNELLDAVWKDAFVTPNAMTRVIAHLRKAIGDEAKEARYIETVPTRGYRFIAAVKEVNGQGAGSIASLAEETGGLKSGEGEMPAPAPSRIAAEEKTEKKRSLPSLTLPLALLGGLGLLALAALLIWKPWSRSVPPAIPGVLKTAQITTWSGLDIFPSLSPDGSSIAYSSDRSGNFEIYVKQLAPRGREIQITADGEQNFEPAWSPDGQMIAFHSRNRRGIWLVPALGGPPKQLTDFGSYPAWSPDSSFIAFQSNELGDVTSSSSGALPPSTIWIIAASGGRAKQITQTGSPPGGHGAPSWSPDGNRIAFATYELQRGLGICSVSTKGDQLKQITTRGADPIYSPDGEAVYFTTFRNASNFSVSRIQVLPKSDEPVGEAVEVMSTGTVPLKRLTLSKDGKKIAYTAIAFTSNLWATSILAASQEAKGPPFPLTRETSLRNSAPAYSPDGRKIAYATSRIGATSDIWVMDADGQNQTQLTTDPANDTGPTWISGGEQIVFASNRQGHFKLWAINLKTGKEQPLLDLGPNVTLARISPDGQQIAFSSNQSGATNIWTTGIDGGPPKQLTFDQESMQFPFWSLDGRFLVFGIKRRDDMHVGIIPSHGGTPAQLTSDPGQSWANSLSPDGDKIAFAGFRHGYWNLYWVSRRTKEQKQLTNYQQLNTYVRYPVWSPLGNQIIYEYAETKGNIWLVELK